MKTHFSSFLIKRLDFNALDIDKKLKCFCEDLFMSIHKMAYPFVKSLKPVSCLVHTWVISSPELKAHR